MRALAMTLALLLAASAAAGQNAPPTPLPPIQLPPELDRVLRDYERNWRAADAKALAALFTDDGFVPTSGGWVRGHDAIRRVYERAGGDLQLRALGFAVQDTVGYIVGAYGYADSPGGADVGKFVLALRRAPGGPWLIAADLDSSNRP